MRTGKGTPNICSAEADPFTFASKEHIFFAHRAPWGEIKQSRAQIEALAEICAIGVTFPVRIVEVHNGYMFLAATGIL